jgi:protocatechuate 3,4-dioxygenase beta subunit
MGPDEHDLGLVHDLARLRPTSLPRLDRRRALVVLGGGGAGLLLAACGSKGGSDDAGSSTSSSSASTAAAAGEGTSSEGVDAIPEETAGPFPGDGTNGPDVLDQDGVVRSDLRSSFGRAIGTAAGVPMTIDLRVVAAGSTRPKAGAALYLWHCDREGRYSLYSSGATEQNYLRGVQVADGDGHLRFTTIFPAAYSGRWPHLHFEVFPSLGSITGGSRLVTSQLALPKEACDRVYATSGYEQSVRNLQQLSMATDMVFADGASLQVPTIAGDVATGLALTHTIGV